MPTSRAESPRAYGAVFLEVGANLGYGGAVNAAVRSLGPETQVRAGLESRRRARRRRPAYTRRSTRRQPAVPPPRVPACSMPTARRIRPPAGCPSLRTGVGHALLTGVWPSQPVDARLSCGRVEARRALRRLAERVVRAAAPERLRRRRRLRRGLFHVLRRRRPRFPARPGRLVEPLRAERPGGAHRRPLDRDRVHPDAQGAPRQRLPLPAEEVPRCRPGSPALVAARRADRALAHRHACASNAPSAARCRLRRPAIPRGRCRSRSSPAASRAPRGGCRRSSLRARRSLRCSRP